MLNKTAKEKNILLVSARSVTRHGVQNTILDIIRASPSSYSFTWYCPGTEEKSFAEEVRQEGVTVVTGGLDLFRCDEKTQYRTVACDIWRLCHEKKYDVIHVNTGVVKFQAVALLTSMLCGVPERIAHSHNSIPFVSARILSRFKRFILEKAVCFAATKMAACSQEAAKALFGKRQAKKALVILNRIDTKKYAFSSEKRDQLRKELALEENLVIGHIGAFKKQKNHQFLIKVFCEVASRNSRARLLLVGSGRLEKEIRLQIKQYGLEQKVIFTGYTDRVSEYLCAMDMFLLPSLYEGFGIVNLEAQASGLPCIVSDTTPPEARVANNFTFLPLNAGVTFWADKLLSVESVSDAERAKAWMTVQDAGYDVKDWRQYIPMLYN